MSAINTDIRILNMFKTQLVAFCEELVKQFPQEPDFVMLKLFIESQIPIEDLVIGFTKQINKREGIVKNMIKQRNDKFFLEENPFKFISDERVNKISILWGSNISQEEKDVIWDWVDVLVKISDRALVVKT